MTSALPSPPTPVPLIRLTPAFWLRAGLRCLILLPAPCVIYAFVTGAFWLSSPTVDLGSVWTPTAWGCLVAWVAACVADAAWRPGDGLPRFL